MKKKYLIDLKSRHGKRRPGRHMVSKSLRDHLVKYGKAVDVKEEKQHIETKEEKFAPEITKSDYPRDAVQDLSGISISKLKTAILTATEDELLGIIKNDWRKTAVKMAEDELKRRGA